MEEAAPLRLRARDVLHALVARPFGPLCAAGGVWLLFVAGFFAWLALAGSLDYALDARYPLHLTPSARTQLVTGLLIAFLLATRWRLETRAAEDWSPVQPLTGLSPEAFREFVGREIAPSARHRLGVDAAGALLGTGVVFLSTGEAELSSGSLWRPTLLWALASNAVVFVLLARTLYASAASRSAERVASRITEIDLLDTRPLRCFGRQGLRRAFYWAGGSSIASLLAWNLDRIGPLLAIIALTMTMASLALLESVRVVRRRIRRAKDAELERTRRRIRAAREELRGEHGAADLPALLAWEQRIEAVSEWPFDTPTLLRFGALALLATGSWLGGALVERLLDVALD